MAEKQDILTFITGQFEQRKAFANIAHNIASEYPEYSDPFQEVTGAVIGLVINSAWQNKNISFSETFHTLMKHYGFDPIIEFNTLTGIEQIPDLPVPPFPSKEELAALKLQAIYKILSGFGPQGFVDVLRDTYGFNISAIYYLYFIMLEDLQYSGDPGRFAGINSLIEYLNQFIFALPAEQKTIKELKKFFISTFSVAPEAVDGYFRLYMYGLAQYLVQMGLDGAQAFLMGHGFGRQFVNEVLKYMSPSYKNIMESNAPLANSSIEALLAKVPANAPNAALARKIIRDKFGHRAAHLAAENTRSRYSANVMHTLSGPPNNLESALASVKVRHPTISKPQINRTRRKLANSAYESRYIHPNNWTPAAAALSGPGAVRQYKPAPPAEPRNISRKNFRVSWNNEASPALSKKRRVSLPNSRRKRSNVANNGLSPELLAAIEREINKFTSNNNSNSNNSNEE